MTDQIFEPDLNFYKVVGGADRFHCRNISEIENADIHIMWIKKQEKLI